MYQRVWARVLGAQRSCNIAAVFGQRLPWALRTPCVCESSARRPLVVETPLVVVGREKERETRGPPLPFQSRKSSLRVSSSSSRATCVVCAAARSFLPIAPGSNKSAGFYSCPSDILYSAPGPRGPSPRASPSFRVPPPPPPALTYARHTL